LYSSYLEDSPRPDAVQPEPLRAQAINPGIYGERLSVQRPQRIVFAEAHYRYRQPWFWSHRTYVIPLTLTAPDTGDTDTANGWHRVGKPAATRWSGGSNYAFADGHAKWYRPDEITLQAEARPNHLPTFAP
jgi:prepilin-type processing-associated H-X9-DG protein